MLENVRYEKLWPLGMLIDLGVVFWSASISGLFFRLIGEFRRFRARHERTTGNDFPLSMR